MSNVMFNSGIGGGLNISLTFSNAMVSRSSILKLGTEAFAAEQPYL